MGFSQRIASPGQKVKWGKKEGKEEEEEEEEEEK